jgi:hypothetical protein
MSKWWMRCKVAHIDIYAMLLAQSWTGCRGHRNFRCTDLKSMQISERQTFESNTPGSSGVWRNRTEHCHPETNHLILGKGRRKWDDLGFWGEVWCRIDLKNFWKILFTDRPAMVGGWGRRCIKSLVLTIVRVSRQAWLIAVRRASTRDLQWREACISEGANSELYRECAYSLHSTILLVDGLSETGTER